MASKKYERVLLDGFAAQSGWLFDNIEQGESPDFIVDLGDGRIGVEVTQVFKNEDRARSNRETESYRSKFLARLAARYYEIGGLPLLAKAIFDGADHRAIPDLAARLVASRSPVPWDHTELAIDLDDAERAQFFLTSLPAEAGEYRRWLCINNSLGWVACVAPSDLARKIRLKNEKLSSYMQKADRVVLLIVADRTSESGMLIAGRDALQRSHGFEAIYFYSHPHEARRIA